MATGGNIEVFLEGRGILTLRPSDQVATGGEGFIYKAFDTIVKIYKDPAKMKRDGMADKIKLLSTIKNKMIVSPSGLVTNRSGSLLGFYMPFNDGQPLSRVFTNSFRQREGFTDDHSSMLVNYMRDVVDFAHNKGAVLVDANEMNWLVDFTNHNKPEPRVIDVDSWSIAGWPTTTIMPSIRDYHTKGFNQITDWFAWGVVTFQIYTGIHPYKGSLAGYKPIEMEKRMRDNASVFSSGVGLNQAVRDFSVIPGPLLDWYVQTFQKGKRTMPPSPFDTGIAGSKVARILRAVTTASGKVVFEKIYSKVNDPVVRVFSCGVVLLKSGKLVDLSSLKEIGTVQSRDCEVIKSQRGWLKADIAGRDLKFSYINETSLTQESLELNIAGDKLISYEDRLFVVTAKGLTELILSVFNKPILSVGNSWNVMVNSTRWFDGVGVQDALGAMFVVVPFGDRSCAYVRVRELDGLKVVAAKTGNRFVSVVGLDKNGYYQKIELTMNSDYSQYQALQTTVDSSDLNLVVLPKGVCATIVDDGELVVFVPVNGNTNKVSDKNISTKMVLANWGNKVVYIQDGGVWSLKMH